MSDRPGLQCTREGCEWLTFPITEDEGLALGWEGFDDELGWELAKIGAALHQWLMHPREMSELTGRNAEGSVADYRLALGAENFSAACHIATLMPSAWEVSA